MCHRHDERRPRRDGKIKEAGAKLILNMENPWIKLSKTEPFILESDKESIERFNLISKSEHILHTHLLPIPFLGNPSAPILLLNLNPGFHCDDNVCQKTIKFEDASRNCLVHGEADYPLYFLDSLLEGQQGGAGYKWWSRILSQLLKKFDAKLLSQNIFCVEYFPYRSIKFRQQKKILDSQLYGFHLVRLAMQRQAQIILMRAKKHWFQAIPELASYNKDKLHTLKNPRNPSISEGNLPESFNEIICTIERARNLPLCAQ